MSAAFDEWSTYAEGGMFANVRAVELYLRHSLTEIPGVAGLQGTGVFLGVEFSEPIAADLQRALLRQRVITGTCDDPTVLRLLPALCLSVEAAEGFIARLKDVVAGKV
jgi:acetylornithine/N-succinyldiaminopimelate aminotransferase